MADSILRLRVESQEYDNKLKRATEGLQRYVDGARKIGGTLEVVEKETLDYVKALGQMETHSRSAKGKINEMTKSYIDLSAQYRRLTAEEKKSPVGKALAQSLDTLKGRIKSAEAELKSINSELKGTGTTAGNLSGILGELGSRFGISSELTSTLTTGTIGLTAAVGAAATAVGVAIKQWAEYNTELSKQSQILTVTTGLQGESAGKMTANLRALARTYDVDFREAVNAANTLMQQFGIDGDEAMQILRDGMQGMIQGDGPKLLQMIQQFAPSFRDAGISASQLVAIIQNSEGGIFTDQNMNAIVMGIKNVRQMLNTTRDALNNLGIDADKITEKLNDGSMTIFEALRIISNQIQAAGTSSKAVGDVMQYVFGRQGTAAGTNLAKAIETLNTNLDETKTQTGELGGKFADLQKANEDLEKVMAEMFGMNGWQEMAVDIETKVKVALVGVLNTLKDIKTFLDDNTYGKAIAGVTDHLLRQIPVLNQIYMLAKGISKEMGANAEANAVGDAAVAGQEDFVKVMTSNMLDEANVTAFSKKFGTGTGGTGGTGGKQEVKTSEPIVINAPGIVPVNTPDKGLDNIYGFGLGTQLFRQEMDGMSIADRKALFGHESINEDEQDKTKGKPKEDKKQISAMEKLTTAMSGLSSIMSGIQSLGIELPSGLEKTVSVIQGLISIVQGVQTIISVFATTSQTANTIALESATAALWANTYAHYATGWFSTGGIAHAANGVIAGQSYAGDKVPIAVNSGEMIINQTDQRKLFDALHGENIGMNFGNMQLVLKGEDIYLAQKNYRKGVGL